MSAQKHIVAQAAQAWGHTRPLVNLSARLTKLQPDVYVTILTTNLFHDRAKAELARNFDSLDEEAAQRVRLVALGHVEMLLPPPGDKTFENMWNTLMAEEGPTCARSGTRYPGVAKPGAVIIDLFSLSEVAYIQNSSKSVKVFGWMSAMTYAGVHIFGPEKLGGKGNIRLKAEEEAQRTGRPYADIVLEMSYVTTDEVIRLPGMPPMYQYEQHPQDFPMPPEVAIHVLPRIYEMIESMDGMALASPQSYEPSATAAMKAWFEERGRTAFLCGPLLPSGGKVSANENEIKQSAQGAEIQAFLDATLKTSGQNSLLYISFGSLFWPVKAPEAIWAFLDVVMELQIPFILSHASPFAVIPDEVKEKVKAYGKGLLSSWSPQQLILDHPATGWFVTHGGHNSLVESMVSGVPTIFWPFGADQPLNAVLCTDNHQISYELFEIRTGHGLKPICRSGYTPVGTTEAIKTEARDVLTKAFGDDGAAKRERLQILRKGVLGEWEEGGASRCDVEAFLSGL